jgi:hypothetical protein
MTTQLNSISKNALMSKVTSWLSKPGNQLFMITWTVRIVSWLFGLGEGPLIAIKLCVTIKQLNYGKNNRNLLGLRQ